MALDMTGAFRRLAEQHFCGCNRPGQFDRADYYPLDDSATVTKTCGCSFVATNALIEAVGGSDILTTERKRFKERLRAQCEPVTGNLGWVPGVQTGLDGNLATNDDVPRLQARIEKLLGEVSRLEDKNAQLRGKLDQYREQMEAMQDSELRPSRPGKRFVYCQGWDD